MWDVINFFLILLLLIIIITVLLSVIYFYYCFRKYVDDTINNIGSNIPLFHSYEYDSFDYKFIENLSVFNSTEKVNFNNGLAKLLCSINMSSYNIYSDFSPGLPDEIEHIDTISNNCFIYKIKNTNIKIISYRGTRTSDDVLTDLDSVQTEMSGYSSEILSHRGFYRLWAPQKDEIRNFIKKYNKTSTILVTGHSLGCASALYTSMLISSDIEKSNIHLYMFAPPRIGNHHLIKKLNELVPNNYAIINTPDIVPNLPFVTFPTLGNTWFYENFTNRYMLDLQMGAISSNHRLDTYMCGLYDNDELEEKNCKNAIWKKLPIYINNI